MKAYRMLSVGLAAVGAASVATAASAQDFSNVLFNGPLDSPVARETLAADGILALDGGRDASNTKAELLATDDGGLVTLSQVWSVSGGTLSLTATAPTSEGEATDLASLDGFGSATTIEARVSTPVGRGGRWSIFGKVGRKEFEYFEPITLVERSEEQTPWSAGASLTLITSSRSAVGGSVSYVSTWKARPSQVVCPAGAPPVVCVNGPIGAPTSSEGAFADLEVRWAVTPRVGVVLKAAHDFEAEVTGLDLPIYLISGPAGLDGSKPLIGGIRFGWRDDTDRVTVGLFVGKTF